MSDAYLQLLLVVVYLLSGTLCVVLAGGWALKRFGQSKHDPKHPHTRNGKDSGLSP